MYDVEANPSMKLDCLLISPPQPEQVMKPEASASPTRIPRVAPFGNGYPMEFQIDVGMVGEEFLDSNPIVRVCDNPDPVPLRELPSPVPGEAGFRTLARTTRVPHQKHSHCNFLGTATTLKYVGCGSVQSAGPDSPTLKNSDRKSTRLNSSHDQISYAVFCL